ncbi:efflux RND transporter periplasmic adaptor subunit [Dongshaea marina]|uniref:efflux RND transporter periplasmic adaptor subunit n=1 Tax=Dongshaea marina TaxID=2047966 RepID=UPI00190230FF|nr:efflux RND transporter periplasmic adaptor subunit [Dongshaea marina]
MRLGPLSILLSGLLLAACGDTTPQPQESLSRPVKLQAVSIGNSASLRHFPAVVEAGDKAVLAFRVSGQLKRVDARPGDLVTRGQILATLNEDELLLLVQQARANHDLARVKHQRNSELRKTNYVSEYDFDTSKAALKQARATLDKAKANLGYATLSAPYDGQISLSMVENFEYINAKQAVMHIQSANIINIVFELPSHLLPRVKESGSDLSPGFTLIP